MGKGLRGFNVISGAEAAVCRMSSRGKVSQIMKEESLNHSAIIGSKRALLS